MEKYDVQKSIEAQKKYCGEKGLPHFAPYSGVCWKCHKNIYEPHHRKYGDRDYETGITTEKAGRELVTGCPHCNRSYCD